jgi:hypothetical protein
VNRHAREDALGALTQPRSPVNSGELLSGVQCLTVMEQDKRSYRQLKRDIKRAGNRQRRRHLQRDLQNNPEDAPLSDFDFGRRGTASLNGNDHDAKRRKRE